MHKLTVLYGHPKDPAEFDRYYYETHIPLAKKMQGLMGLFKSLTNQIHASMVSVSHHPNL